MANGRAKPLVEECQRQVENCLYTSTSLYIWIKWLRGLRAVMTVAGLLLGSLATWKVLTDSPDGWSKAAVAVFAFAAGFIPTVVRSLRLDESLSQLNTLANEFKNLQDRFRFIACFTITKGITDAEAEFRATRVLMENLRVRSTAVPEWAFRAAQKKIKTQDYQFDIDQAVLDQADAAGPPAGSGTLSGPAA